MAPLKRPGWAWVFAVAFFVVSLYGVRPELPRRTRTPIPTGATFVQLSRGRTRYALSSPKDDFTETQLVVLVAGLASPMETMMPLARELRKRLGVRTLNYDVFGRGWSDLPSGPLQPGPRVEVYVAQLVELLFALNETGKVTLVGLSMGGAIVSGFARTYPERTDKLLLFAPAVQELGVVADAALSALRALPEWILLAACELFVPQLMTISREREYKTRTDQVRDIFHTMGSQDPKIIVAAIVSNILGMDLTAILAGYEETARLHKGHTLLVWGEEDTVAPLALGRKLYERMSKFRRVDFWSIPNFGHSVVSEDVDSFPAIVSYIVE